MRQGSPRKPIRLVYRKPMRLVYRTNTDSGNVTLSTHSLFGTQKSLNRIKLEEAERGSSKTRKKRFNFFLSWSKNDKLDVFIFSDKLFAISQLYTLKNCRFKWRFKRFEIFVSIIITNWYHQQISRTSIYQSCYIYHLYK